MFSLRLRCEVHGMAGDVMGPAYQTMARLMVVVAVTQREQV
jgi:hypothetical protein